MQVTRPQALNAGKEFYDLAHLIVDEIPNDQQYSEFFSEGFQAANAIRATVIPPDKRQAVLSAMTEGFLHENNMRNPEFMLPEA